MATPIAFRTNKKTGKKFPINAKKSRSSLVSHNLIGSVKSSGRKSSDYKKRRLMLYKKMIQHRKPWEENWRSSSYKIGKYSFRAIKKHGINDYYIKVKHEQKEFLSIPLKPLINRGISFGLSTITGLPIDMELAEKVIHQIINDSKLDDLLKLATH